MTPETEVWWLREAGALDEPPAPALRQPLEADVAIVGGGYVGLWTAVAIKTRAPDTRVALVERARSGFGPSGRNGGFLHGYWSMLPWLRETLGAPDALRLARAGDAILPAVRELEADVWLREGGMLEVATTPEQERALGHAVDVAAELGVPEEAVLLSREEVRVRCGSSRFRGGVYFRECATVQPARLVRALRARALAAGVELYEQTPALRVRSGVVETPAANIRASSVVLATNAALAGWRGTARRIAAFRSYVVLTEPIPDAIAELGWTGGEAIADGRMFLHYFRTTADGRILMGSAGGSQRHAERGLRLLFPTLRDARITHHWGGPIDVSADRLPLVGERGGIRYAAGFTGNGVGPSWLAAQALASRVLGLDDEWSALPLVDRDVPALPPDPLKRLGGALVRNSVLALEEADEEGRRAPLLARAGAQLPRLARSRIGLR